MKLQDLSFEGINFKDVVNGNFLNLSQDEINRIIEGVYTKIVKEKNYNPSSENYQKKISPLLDVNEALEYLKIKRTTLDKLKKTGELNYRQIGGGIFFTYDDLDDYIKRCSSNRMAMCIKSNIYLESKNQDIIPHKNGKTYYIYKENKKWVYLLSDRLIRLRRKEYNKYFKNAEDYEIDAYIYNLLGD